MKKIHLIALILLSCIWLHAEETNRLFVTVNELNQRIPDDISRTNEYLPAEQFPDGNWGRSTNGLQLSLRFDKASYTNGEPIQATVLVRNVSGGGVDFHFIHVLGFDGPVRFIATREDDRKVEGVEWGPVEGIGTGLPFGHQWRVEERFDKEYHLTNGTFFIRAYVVVGPGRTYAESAKVPIKIEE